MSIYVIAALYKNKLGKRIGYRILDSLSGDKRDVPYDNLYNVVASNRVKIMNVGIENGELVGTNGSLDRYSKVLLPSNTVFDEKSNTIVILKKLGDYGFRIANHDGKIVDVDEKKAIDISEAFGIANGKVVTRDDGTKFISAISGNYEYEDYIDLNKPDIDKNKIIESAENKNKSIGDKNKTIGDKNISIGDKNIQIDNKNKTIEPKISTDISDVLTDEQKRVIANYYLYIRSSTSLEVDEKSEIEDICSDIRNNRLSNNYDINVGIVTMLFLNPYSKLSKIMDASILIHVEKFAHEQLPFPKSMVRLFNKLADNIDDRKKLLSCLFEDDKNGVKGYYAKINYCDYNINSLELSEIKFVILAEIIKYMDRVSALQYIISSVHVKTDVNLLSLRDIANEEFKNSSDISYKIIVDGINCVTGGNDIKYNISDMLSIMDYDDLDDRIKSALVNVFNAYDNKLTTDEPKSVDSLVEKFNEAYKEHIEKEAQENQDKDTDEHLETETGSKTEVNQEIQNNNQAVQNNAQAVQNNSNNQLVEKPNTMTTYEWLKYLLDNNPDIDRNNVSVKIAIDIIERNVDRLSYKQQYRVNDAIRICEKANKNRLKVVDTSNTGSKETQNTDDSTYEVYELDEKPDIKNIVNELISKANSVEMSKVLEEYPNVIKICYSVLGRNKVSTRQLKHINGAYAMIKNQ